MSVQIQIIYPTREILTKTYGQYRHRQGRTNIKTKKIKVPMLDQ